MQTDGIFIIRVSGLTHMYGGAVAACTRAVAVIGSDCYVIDFTAVQVLPGAAGPISNTQVCVSILTHCCGSVHVRPITWAPADRTQLIVTLEICHEIKGRAGRWITTHITKEG